LGILGTFFYKTHCTWEHRVEIAAEWRKRISTVKCTGHGDNILYTTYNNIVR
jgi:hypothetical protein